MRLSREKKKGLPCLRDLFSFLFFCFHKAQNGMTTATEKKMKFNFIELPFDGNASKNGIKSRVRNGEDGI